VKKPLRTNLLLLLIVLVLIVLLNLPTQPTTTEAATQLNTIAANSVTRIRLDRGKDDQIVLEKQAGEWWMTSPRKWPANHSRIQSLLKLLQQRHYGQFSAEATDLSHYGLQTPLASIHFNQSIFSFGTTETLNHRRYLQHEQQIYMIEDSSLYKLISMMPRYLSTRLLREDEKIIALTLPGLSLTQKDGKWHGSQKDVHADDIVRLLQDWQTASALSVDIDEKTETKDKPMIKLRLNTQTSTVEFAIIQHQPDLLLLRLDNRLLYQLHPHQAQQLLQLTTPQPQ